jgi:ribosomal protein S12 methylthiotransferase
MSNKLHMMLGRLKAYEMTDDSTEAVVIIVTTCGFIDAAKQESINTMLNLDADRKENSVLVMAGCMSERYQDELSKELTEVDIFTGVGDYANIDKLLAERESRFSDAVYLIDGEERVVTGSTYHAYIKISEGCNQTCSFCAIPSFKGKLNSRNLDSIAKEVEGLVARGYYDFSFISQDSSSFLRDQNVKDGLIHLIKRIELIDGVKSARILYLYPSTTSMKLLQEIAKSKLFHNYFDMPIQHINDDMLRMMKRGFGKEKTLEQLNYMRSLANSFVRTTFIVGHPGETEAMFDELCDFVKAFGFDRANVFGYSDEEGTAAYTAGEKLPQAIIDERADILGAICKDSELASLQAEIGKEIELVIDGESDEHEFLLSARKTIWAPEIDGEIYVNDKEIDEEFEFGVIYRAKVTDLVGTILTATVIGHAE